MDWRSRAVCRDEDPELFFVPGDERTPAARAQIGAAKAVCARCPVASECLKDALEIGDAYGVRGARSADERRNLRKNRAAGEKPSGPRISDVDVEILLSRLDAGERVGVAAAEFGLSYNETLAVWEQNRHTQIPHTRERHRKSDRARRTGAA